MNIIFRKENFELCHVPVPKGYPQSQTHAGVATDGRFIYLTTSPFPVIIRPRIMNYLMAAVRRLTFGLICGNNVPPDYYENPCLYIGDSYPLSSNFELMQERPLMQTPVQYYNLPSYNSDPDISIYDDVLYILNRPVYRTKMLDRCRYEAVSRTYLIRGYNDNYHFKFTNLDLLKEYSASERRFVSPCLTRFMNKFYLFEIETNSYNDGCTFDGIYSIHSESIEGLKRAENWSKIKINSSELIPWHMSVFQHNGKLYTIIACVKRNVPRRCWQMLGAFSNDMKTLRIYKTPLTDFNSYRGAAFVDDDSNFIFYNTTVGEKIDKGNSVDGREIIVASMNFNELLAKLESYE